MHRGLPRLEPDAREVRVRELEADRDALIASYAEVVANARGEAERSGYLIGAAEGLHEAVGVPVCSYYVPHRSMYERMMAAVRSQLGGEVFEAVRAEGRKMTFEQAAVYALSIADIPERRKP